MEKLKVVAGNLKVWERERFGSVRLSISDLREELDALQRQTPSPLLVQRCSEVELKLDGILHREEVMWSQ
jgi:hypothetical protein